MNKYKVMIWNNIFYNDIGVLEIKKRYKKNYNGQQLFDLIFFDKFEVDQIKKKDITKVWDHGNSITSVNNSVTAGISGIHIYTTNNEIIGIVIRNISVL